MPESPPSPYEPTDSPRRLLPEFEHLLRSLDEAPFDVADPAATRAFRAVGRGSYQRRRLPSLDELEGGLPMGPDGLPANPDED